MISFIVPAHNEELWIQGCLTNIHVAMAQLGGAYEVIVVNDASTDGTRAIASELAKVIDVELRKIGAVRNAGARVASGMRYFFIDADTKVNAPAIRSALHAMSGGYAGGGCVPQLDGPVPWWGHVILKVAVTAGRMLRLVGGCCLFCTKDTYEKVGGFSEELYAGEDIVFVAAIKRHGRFFVPREAVVTSSRKLSVTRPWEVVVLLGKIALVGHRYESPWVIDLLYGKRARDCRTPDQVGHD